jgi:cysteinyl-tRNA synthetase
MGKLLPAYWAPAYRRSQNEQVVEKLHHHWRKSPSSTDTEMQRLREAVLQEALETYTPRQLRLVFLNQLWSSKMDLKPSTRSEVEGIEEVFNVGSP